MAARKLAERIIAQLKYGKFILRQHSPLRSTILRINLCCGPVCIPGFMNIDVGASSDLPLDLNRRNLPFREHSLDVVVCMSAINYFSRARAAEIIHEVHRVLKPGGIARFGVQDLERLAARYVTKDRDFFFQKLPDGRERFEGPTLGDKFVAWLYGYESGGSPCRYFYDFDALAFLFHQTGFSLIEKCGFQESRIAEIRMIDNRADQMFFLEAVK